MFDQILAAPLLSLGLGAIGGIFLLFVAVRFFFLLEHLVDRGVKVSVEIPPKGRSSDVPPEDRARFWN
jgi:hypothetical protein